MSQLIEHVNGKGQQGRIAPPLPAFTFKDSGVTIQVRKVGPTTQQRLAQQIQRDFPEPPIPVVETELGPEQNAADPEYVKAMEAWQQQTNGELTNRLMLIAALEAEVTIDAQARTEIARRKRHLKLIGIPYEDNPDLTEEENERVFYVLNIAAASPEDLGEFGAAVLRRSVPTEAAVQAQITTFPGDL
jgi:hypothetical protein